MGNRGQKRTETADELPADKRACSSLGFRPSSSVSPVRTLGSTHEIHDADMETSSSTSGSTPSDGDGERYSPSGSCDSGNSYRDYYRQRSSGDQSKFSKTLSNLTEDQGESEQLATLTELCELLSFCTDSSLSGQMADSFSPVLVRLARHESNPDIMLLAIRAITYFCDVHPRASGYLVRHDVVPALCQRLMAIEYLDVAEQCLQALEKISREQPLACLQSGAITAVLSYIDFFSTSVQRVALSTVLNICKKLPSECPSQLMDTVPLLCNLLQYEDRQLVESVATCLIRIAERVCCNYDMLDELCKHGLIQQFADLMNLNGRASLSQPVYLGLIGLLVKLASDSILAIRILFEVNISSILKDILSSFDLSHGIPSSVMVDGQSNQVHEVLKLLNELLPSNTEDYNPLELEKQEFLTSRPDLLQRFGLDVLPVLVQVVNSGTNLHVCYGCLSVISKLIYFSRSDMLLEFLQSTNISSFLAGVFTRKDLHVLLLALKIVEAVLQKHANVFLDSFIKEGVLFAIDALLSPERCSPFMFPSCNDVQFLHDTAQKSSSRDVGCLCFSFNSCQSPVATKVMTCKLEKDSIKNIAEHIKNNYFGTELLDTEKGFTDILQKLQTLSVALTDLVNKSTRGFACGEDEEQFYPVLQQIMSVLGGKDPISTFEFVESGIVKSLLNYLFNGKYAVDKAENQGLYQMHVTEKRFEVLGKLLVYISETPFENSILTTLIRRLQSALSSMETFPVILSQGTKLRNSYATVPYGHVTSYPCLKVLFVKGEGENLSDYFKDVVNVDPFSTMDAIDKYLWPKVSSKRTYHHPYSENEASEEKECSSSQSPSCSSPSQARSVDTIESDGLVSHANEIQVELVQEGGNTGKRCPGCTSSEDASQKLILYLDGHELDHSLTLYQALVQQKFTSENNWIPSAELWNQLYKITYRRAFDVNKESPEQCSCHDSPSYGLVGAYLQYPAFFSSILSRDLVSLNQPSPTYDILYLLRCLECINRFRFHMMSRERIYAFAKGRICGNLDNLKMTVSGVPQSEFVSSRITEKFEQQMRDALAISVGAIPSWCSQLMATCSFLFGFETKCKYFRLAAFNKQAVEPLISHHDDVGSLNGRRQYGGSHARKKFLVHRDKILDSATEMMNLHAHQRVVLEVEYNDEVGTGLGPTLEFYTLVCHEFQKSGLCLWREDHSAVGCLKSLDTEGSRNLVAPLGLFPRPWSDKVQTFNGTEFSKVTEKFVLLGQIVAKALQDGRVLDLPFSKAFYKLILGKELTVYDIQSFDLELGRALLEFQALIEKKRCLDPGCQDKSSAQCDISFHGTKIEDLCLEFCVPGYPDYSLDSVSGSKMVSLSNLEEYVSFVTAATIKTGISRQVEAFKSGFEQVFPISHLQLFHEDELDRLLCGERELWNSNDLSDHVKFDHGYTASSPPIVNLLEIIQEFDHEQQRAFLRFVTGTPRLPPGGLAALNPKLTIVRKHCSNWADGDLPSVMTCANYLKLPPYSSKERMKEKLLYAIKEGQDSFHLS